MRCTHPRNVTACFCRSAFAATRQPLLDRAWGWLGSMASRLAPRSGSWGVGAYRRYTADPHLHTDDWPPNDHLMRTSHEQQLLWLQQQGVPSRLSLDQPPFTLAVPSFGGAGGTPLGQLRPLRRHSQLASCQTSSEGMAGIASCAGLGPVGVAENGSLALGRASQGSQASFWDNADLSPEERLQQCQQYAQLAKEKVSGTSSNCTSYERLDRQQHHYTVTVPAMSAQQFGAICLLLRCGMLQHRVVLKQLRPSIICSLPLCFDSNTVSFVSQQLYICLALPCLFAVGPGHCSRNVDPEADKGQAGIYRQDGGAHPGEVGRVSAHDSHDNGLQRQPPAGAWDNPQRLLQHSTHAIGGQQVQQHQERGELGAARRRGCCGRGHCR